MKRQSRLLIALLVACTWFPVHEAGAALFEDDEARRHILDMRAKMKEVEEEKADKASLLEVANQNEALREEIARLKPMKGSLSAVRKNFLHPAVTRMPLPPMRIF